MNINKALILGSLSTAINCADTSGSIKDTPDAQPVPQNCSVVVGGTAFTQMQVEGIISTGKAPEYNGLTQPQEAEKNIGLYRTWLKEYEQYGFTLQVPTMEVKCPCQTVGLHFKGREVATLTSPEGQSFIRENLEAEFIETVKKLFERGVITKDEVQSAIGE